MPKITSDGTPLHCGLPVVIEFIREIEASHEEQDDGILETRVTVAHCAHPTCGKRLKDEEQSTIARSKVKLFYTEYRYPGGWGPIGKVTNGPKTTKLQARLKLARESDWVWGQHPEYLTPQKKWVRA